MAARSRHPQLVGWSCRLYALVLFTYPPNLREYRRELLITFRNRSEDIFNSGSTMAVLRFALHIAADWLRTMTSEGPEEPMALSVLGLGARDGEARGCLDRSTFTVGLLLATLGVFLLIAGWYEWLTYKALFLSHHRPM
jgi:hypothetical protein